MKKAICGIIVWATVCQTCPVCGQDAVLSQFMFDNLSVNPALAGINDYHKVTVGFREQQQAYQTYFVSYDRNIADINSGIGVQVFRDVGRGVYSRTSAELMYSYRFHPSRHLTVATGLQAAVVQRSVNVSGLTLPDDSPYAGSGYSESLSNRSAWFPDFGCGVVANYTDRYSVGVAAHHLNGAVETLSEINKKRMPISLSAHFISYFPLRFGKFHSQKMVFSPGFYFRKQQYQNFFSMGANVAYNTVFVGIWSRFAGKFSPESVIFFVGIEQNYFRFVYNYDHKLSMYASKSFPGTGAHEITLVWKIHPKKKMHAIKCSKYSLQLYN
jgi:type IX secretion system PorP/SprF family membrane protein